MTTVSRDNVTTISIPSSLKDTIESIKNEDQSYADFLADLLDSESLENLQQFQGPDDTLGDVIRRVLGGGGRSPEEFEQFLDQARNHDDTITADSITVDRQ